MEKIWKQEIFIKTISNNFFSSLKKVYKADDIERKCKQAAFFFRNVTYVKLFSSETEDKTNCLKGALREQAGYLKSRPPA